MHTTFPRILGWLASGQALLTTVLGRGLEVDRKAERIFLLFSSLVSFLSLVAFMSDSSLQHISVISSVSSTLVPLEVPVAPVPHFLLELLSDARYQSCVIPLRGPEPAKHWHFGSLTIRSVETLSPSSQVLVAPFLVFSSPSLKSVSCFPGY